MIHSGKDFTRHKLIWTLTPFPILSYEKKSHLLIQNVTRSRHDIRYLGLFDRLPRFPFETTPAIWCRRSGSRTQVRLEVRPLAPFFTSVVWAVEFHGIQFWYFHWGIPKESSTRLKLILEEFPRPNIRICFTPCGSQSQHSKLDRATRKCDWLSAIDRTCELELGRVAGLLKVPSSGFETCVDECWVLCNSWSISCEIRTNPKSKEWTKQINQFHGLITKLTSANLLLTYPYPS